MPRDARYGELLGDAVLAETQEEADQIFQAIMAFARKEYPDTDPDKIEDINRSNIGYYAGYCDRDVRARVERFYKAPHPILGSVIDQEPLSLEQVFQKGVEMGRRMKE